MSDIGPKGYDLVALSSDFASVGNQRIHEIEHLSRQVEISKRAASDAKAAALKAGHVSTRWGPFVKLEAVSELQTSGTAQAKAIGALADTQTKFFEQQQRFATSVSELTMLAIANKASAQSVYRQLEAKLSGADAATLTELAKQELISVMVQARQTLDLIEQNEQIEQSLARHDDEIPRIKTSHSELVSFVEAWIERVSNAEVALLRLEQSRVEDRRAQEESLARLVARLEDADSSNGATMDLLRGEIVSLRRRTAIMVSAILASAMVGIGGLVVALGN